MTTIHAVTTLAIVGFASLGASGCGADEWKCSPPGGAIATEGRFDLDFTGETASFASEAMRVYVTPTDDQTLEIWACQERGDEMWTAEVTVTQPTALTLPATFGLSAGTPRALAWVTRYDDYQVLEEQFGNGLSSRVTGSLDAFDVAEGELVLDATLTEQCPAIVCQAMTRDVALTVDLTWEPR